MADPVVTPEAVAIDLEPATVGSRCVALLLDYLLIGGALLLLGMVEAAFGFSGYVPGWLGIALVLLLVAAVQLGYPVAFETLWRGRTPGKAAMGLRVLTAEGAPEGFRHAAVRMAVGLVELQATMGAVAVVTSFVSARGQRLGDLAAGTVVVRERRASGQPRAHQFLPPPGLEDHVRTLDVSRLDVHDYATVRDLLVRPQLDVGTRESVAREIAEAIQPRVRPAPPPGITATTWLQAVAAAVQARQGSSPGQPPPTASTPPRETATRSSWSGGGGAGDGAGSAPGGTSSGPAQPDPAAHDAGDDEPGPPPPPTRDTGFRPPD